MLAGCSDIYYDRRDTVALGAEEHIASNRVAQMIDPWPRDVGRRDIAFNGQKMQSAVERYRTGRTISPVNVTTSSAAYQEAEKQAASTMNEVTPFSTPAAPVK
jgi:ABC-type glutathione transport system ATPase component